MRKIFLYSILALTLHSPAGNADQYTYWYSGNFPTPVFADPLQGCNYLYSDNWWGHLKDLYLPELNSYSSEAQYHCVMKASTFPGGYRNFGDFTRKIIDCKDGTSFDYNTNKCQYTNQKGKQKESPVCATDQSIVGNVVNTALGNNFVELNDYSTPTFRFTINYNSADSRWRHNLSSHLYFANGKTVLVMADGAEHSFTGNNNILKSATDWGVIENDDSDLVYTSKTGDKLKFRSNGSLRQIITATGQVISLSPNGDGTDITIGGTIIGNFKEDILHQPVKFTAPGFSAIYTYTSNRLTSVSRTANGQTVTQRHLYEVSGKPSLLTGITDENGVRSATWGYDTLGRVILGMSANGANKTTVAYKQDGSTTVTNEYGQKSTYRFQFIQGSWKVIAVEGAPTPNCPSRNSTFTYDALGLMKTKIDAKGNLTTYDYNDRGQETSRTEASGTPQARTVTTEWHPTLFLKTKVTEPGQITTYQYDAQGRQISFSAEAQ